jgi:hypothetical protein
LHSSSITKYKIGFPGWPESVLDPVHGFGVSITKKGFCTSPFFIFQQVTLGVSPKWFQWLPKKFLNQQFLEEAVPKEVLKWF